MFGLVGFQTLIELVDQIIKRVLELIVSILVTISFSRCVLSKKLFLGQVMRLNILVLLACEEICINLALKELCV